METYTSKMIKENSIVNHAFRAGEQLGLSEVETLRRLIKVFVDLQDDAFQARLTEMMCRPQSFIASFKNLEDL